MTIFGVLDLVIGLFFIYFVFSVICTSVVEGFAQVMQWRCKEMNQWVKDTFTNIYRKASSQISDTSVADSKRAPAFWERLMPIYLWRTKWIVPKNGKDTTLGDAILEHHLIKGLTRNGRDAEYIPAHIFSAVLFDLVYTKFQEKEKDVQLPDFYYTEVFESALRSNHELLPEDIRKYLLQALYENRNAGDRIDLVKRRFENWFNDAMERVIGTYKKKTRSWTWAIAFGIAISANVDTISLSKYLIDNSDTAGRKIVEAARQATQDSLLYHEAMRSIVRTDSLLARSGNNAPAQQALIDSTYAKIQRSKERSQELVKSLSEMGLPLGWEHDGKILHKFFFSTNEGDPPPNETALPDPGWGWFLMKILGLTFSALALTVGAPFWFDTINKLVNIRSAGNKPKDNSSNKPIIHG